MSAAAKGEAAPDFGVAGKRVLITGAAGGIGGAFARAFAACGASVVATDRRRPAGALPAGMAFSPLDVTDAEAVAALAAGTGRLDVLLHCAGRVTDRAAERLAEFATLLDLHLTGAFRLAETFRPQLAASRGSILLIASMYAYLGHPRGPGYGATIPVDGGYLAG